MARTFVNSTSDKAENTSSAPVTAPPFTMGGWARITADPTGNDYCIIQIQDKDVSDHYYRLGLDDDLAGVFQFFVNEGGSFGEAEGTTVPNQNQWYHIAAVATAIDNRAIWVSGISEGTSGASRTPANQDSVTIGREADSSPDDSWEGGLAEIAIWNVALVQAELEALAAGYSPLFIRPESLVEYWPLRGRESPEPGLLGWGNLTLTNTSYLDHPPMIYPAPVSYLVPAVVAAPRRIFITHT